MDIVTIGALPPVSLVRRPVSEIEPKRITRFRHPHLLHKYRVPAEASKAEGGAPHGPYTGEPAFPILKGTHIDVYI